MKPTHVGGGLLISAVVHLAGMLLVESLPNEVRPARLRTPRPPRTVALVKLEARPPPDPPKPVPPRRTAVETPKPKKRRAQQKQVISPRRESPAPAPEQVTAAEQTPVRLTGVRLSGLSQGSGFGVTQAGNVAAPPVADSDGTEKKLNPALPSSVPAGDLSRRPVPPNLSQRLRSHYPTALRHQGIEGQALVRVRLSRAGAVTSSTVVRESAAGFGSACQRALSGSVWSAPRDRQGRAVTTVVRYRCRFRIEL